jgi:cytochrome c
MKRTIMTVAAATTMMLFQNVNCAEVDAKWAQAEAKEHGCFNCHEIDKKKVGPSYKEISAKLKGKTAQDVVTLMKSKPLHKAPLTKMSDQDLKMITEWVLSL